jgi:hypothetical protein
MGVGVGRKGCSGSEYHNSASCLEKVENQVENEESQTLSSDDDDSSSIPEEIGLAGTSQPDSSAFSCIEDIDLSSLSPDQLATLAHRLGSSIKQQVVEDSLKHQERYADPESLSDFNLDEYSKSQNEVLTAFIHGLKGIPLKSSHVDYVVCRTVESISATTSSTLLPIHMRESFILYSMCGSSVAMKMLNPKTPYPSYQTIKSKLKKLKDNLNSAASTDIAVAFDNNQILKRTWAVSIEKKFRASTVTMLAEFRLLQSSYLESSPLRLDAQLTELQVQKLKALDQSEEVRYKHNEHVYPVFQKKMGDVLSQQKLVGNVYKDNVDKEIELLCAAENVEKICPKCNIRYSKRKKKCTACSADLEKEVPPPRPGTAEMEHPKLQKRSSLSLLTDEPSASSDHNVGYA